MSTAKISSSIVKQRSEHKKAPYRKIRSFFGAGNVTRTHDLLITNQLLYRLSYTSIFSFHVR
ncbi:hypothetical protein BACCAP_02257 [Pseudoflavonifractor capillosus ATCC 29799]|uniref:Uncharacterized protein n=1 Tax=Pseudoflavonifractor capillosus ATCC 29799 TaxID=411467 RepID=A6NVL4_9FIRM|nr:hypothetical protein BACCAP_02257 [Pseudoflavonifractor capillosus ATCC 29799]